MAAAVEDAAQVLEQFVQDVANLPAEIAHLLEEIEAKDKTAQDCRNVIHTRDSSLQKNQKVNGVIQAHPKEDAYTKTILANFDKAQTLQDDKVLLSEKAGILMDRHIKRLDIQIRTLQTEGLIPVDPQLPSLLNPKAGNRLPALSISTSAANSPLHPIPINAAPSTTIANSALARLVQPSSATSRPHSPAISTTPTGQPPTPSLLSHRSARDSSLGPHPIDPSKRRRLNLPSQSSSLRQSSLGPGGTAPTLNSPKSHPGSQPPFTTTSTTAPRAGSAGPRSSTSSTAGNPTKKPASLKSQLTTPATAARLAQLTATGAGPSSKKPSISARRRANAATLRRSGLSSGLKPSPDPSHTGDDSLPSDMDGASDTPAGAAPSSSSRGGRGASAKRAQLLLAAQRHGTNLAHHQQAQLDADTDMPDADGPRGKGGAHGGGGHGGGQGHGQGQGEEEEEEEDTDADNKRYCTCHAVSYGNMVACDNEECKYEWFHWDCVGMTREPAGKWFCGECRERLGL